jgi:hypothetical protein
VLVIDYPEALAIAASDEHTGGNGGMHAIDFPPAFNS